MRLAHDRYRVVTGGLHGMADLKWFADHLPAGAAVVDQTSAFTTIGLWGPRARDILGRLTDADISHAGFPFLTCRRIELGNVEVLASRISYVGELGWELYVPMEQGARVWDLLHEAGRPDGAVPVGIGVYGTTGRLEKGYRAYGFELDGERTIVEAGMAPAEGQERRLRGPRGLPRAAGGRAADGAVHDDRRRPHVGRRAASATCSAASRSSPATAAR